MPASFQELYDEFSAYARSRPKINTHCHQLPAKDVRRFDLDALLRNTYVNWCGVAWDGSAQSRQNLLDRVRFNSFFVWLQKSLVQLYDADEPLSGTSWQAWNGRIEAAYQDPTHAQAILTGRCAYRRMILDAYWNPGSDNELPDLYAPAYRVNAFFFGYSALAADHDGNSPYRLSPRPFLSDLDGYVAWVRENILAHQASGCVALKVPIAYDRGLDFGEVSPDQARAAFARLTASAGQTVGAQPPRTQPGLPSNAPDPFAEKPALDADPQDVKTFQDYLFFQVCRIAAELDLPVQIHTGMGQGCRTNAGQLQEVIRKSPATRFVLLHCSYPWIQDTSMLVDKYPNVCADLSFLPLISTRAGIMMLHELIERGTTGRVFWGCDTWTPEESYGSLLAFCHVLASALAEKVLEGYFSSQEARLVIDQILFDNPKNFYKLVPAG
jgi:uncharacterized protein